MAKIFVFGWFWPGDLQYLVPNSSKLDYDHGMVISAYLKNPQEHLKLYPALKRAAECDLVIFLGNGVQLDVHVQPLLDDPVAADLFRKLRRKVFWSVDNHHQWQQECAYAKHFDRLYVAHSTYEFLSHPPGTTDKVRFMPCCFWPLSYWELRETLSVAAKTGPDYDVSFTRGKYMVGDRESLMHVIQHKLEHRGLTLNQNFYDDRLEYCGALAKSRVCLNISILSDFNYRNFEAWALNVPLLANRLGTYDQYSATSHGTALFHRDLTDFDDKLDEALNMPKPKTTNAVIADHMLMSRYLSITNLELGTNFILAQPPVL
jgi:hypothetical protein